MLNIFRTYQAQVLVMHDPSDILFLIKESLDHWPAVLAQSTAYFLPRPNDDESEDTLASTKDA